jgi:hypothetical protein
MFGICDTDCGQILQRTNEMVKKLKTIGKASDVKRGGEREGPKSKPLKGKRRKV